MWSHFIGIYSAPVSLLAGLTDSQPLHMPVPGEHQLRVLSPTVLELMWINTKQPDPARVESWDLINGNLQFQAPALISFGVRFDGQPVAVAAIGFKRRPVYAPLTKRDLRIANYLYLRLAQPLTQFGGQHAVEVLNPGGALWPANVRFVETTDPLRFNPAIHVNQVGYTPGLPKRAMIGYYLGSLGELNVSPLLQFTLVDARTGAEVFRGNLAVRLDVGYTYTPPPYQNVLQADFSSFNTPGEYKLVLPGLGASYPFPIHDGVPMAYARSYALGLYHQRCGTDNAAPFTRHTHDACHVFPARIPDPQLNYQFTWNTISNYARQLNPDNPAQIAPALTGENAQLYPFVNQRIVDVSGGHHDAGDYSKYTLNSAALIHYLVFAADSFAGAGALDNLGLPESGDGLSDLLQEAKWEADFLAKMQDTDGGFYFLVYPRSRQYESDVLPDHGDRQVVWPKTTSATAAAVAALAQCASSPLFRRQFPDEAARYLQKAQLGWQFLMSAIARYGKDGAYQKLTHYGDDFTHDDELAWAACELFLATGDQAYHQKLKGWFPNPNAPATRRWGWWRLYQSYGNTIRSYVFATRSRRLSSRHLDADYLVKCESEIRAGANDQVSAARNCAYGSSFPVETKRVRGAGWFFSNERAFDITVAYQLEARSEWLDAILSNLNYEGGINPVNVCYVTGLGWKRQREIVHQYAQNDKRVMPPSGLPIGNIQASFDYLWNYRSELGALCFPQDSTAVGPYPFYDRWGDSFNVATEFVVTDQARSLASMAWLAAQTPLATQPWRSAEARIVGLPSAIMTNVAVAASLQAPGLDLTGARIVWEARDQEPALRDSYTFTATNYGAQWVEAEAVLPDGRRVVASGGFFATNTLPTVRVVATLPDAWEQGPTPGQFSVIRSGYTNVPLTVNYSLGGTAQKFADYRRPQGDMPESVTIPSGQFAADITIVPVDDRIFEGFETATLTLLATGPYNVGTPDHATVTIADNEFGILDVNTSAEGDATITWVSSPGRGYQVECKDALSDSSWITISGVINAFGSTTSWTDVAWWPRAQRFYRIRTL